MFCALFTLYIPKTGCKGTTQDKIFQKLALNDLSI